ncbi:MAG: 50S ribosomal protein L25 [Synergistaceae bacterium]|nr:50S ribosomal protein L25 [Synergistaceae bacterium]
MSNAISITLEERKESGKIACKKLRPAGYTPCVFYGPEYKDSIPAKVKTEDVAKLIKAGGWETVTLNATLPDGKQEMCLMREVQKNFLDDSLLHIDFMQLVKGRKINVNVPVQIVGRETCEGAKQGGLIDHILREISMEVLPGRIPDMITVDVSDLGLGDQLFVRDLDLPSDASLLVDEDEMVVAVMVPRGVTDEEAEEEAIAEDEEEREVEVVAKGKAKDEEEE